MDSDLTYGEALDRIEKVLVQGSAGKAEVFLTSLRGKRFVVKDFGRKGFWERHFLGRIFIGREARAYQGLAGIEGLPGQALRLTPFAIAVEYLEAQDLGSVNAGEIGITVVRQLEKIIDAIHSRGWVHLDLQRRTNILIVNGEVRVIDLASAFRPGALPLLGPLLTRFFGIFDRLSLIKFKRLYAPDALTDNDRCWLKVRNLVMPTKW
ncbi:MAG: hypothetical protein A2X56_04810 [Nitrospirae bacterium GWC2_57_13]|jgi:predicted Ser/Thr protein kinase|nr:MAG: hypothetical protein A2X56_04810 [Nitrospirae bacterium GWC2_57_13]OGW43347.1 MAG: hypothetical protein A2X57_00005 [Nitrospirae bacterium GWD2_57_8]HAS54226.1 hypothetical protein [Nitrospiraceae bacterium]